jgi:spermidine synthase
MSKTYSFNTKKWFVETSFPGIRRCKTDIFCIDKEIYQAKTPFQHAHVFESRGFGRILALDGIIQFTQSDEFVYHETIVHVPLLAHPNPKRFLVVGGGDGGVMREAAKHSLKELYQVEIDRKVVEICRKYLPFLSKGAFDDPRLQLTFEDGKNFMKRYKNFFDVIVVDSTDPVGPGAVLFRGDFYRTVFDALTPNGMAIFQLGPFLDFDLIIRPTARKLMPFARYVRPVRLAMPSYSCGCEYCFMIASKRIDPASIPVPVIARRMKQRLGKKAESLRYLTPALHQASMVMPKIWQL